MSIGHKAMKQKPYTLRKIVYGGVIAWIEADEQ